jgi:hypothetical protein
MFDFNLNPQSSEPTSKCVVRLKTSVWNDSRGIHIKKDITYLRRKSFGFNILEEDVSNIGPEFVVSDIINLNSCSDGIYEVVICNESHDWETGYVDAYNYKLIKVVNDE